ncbi:MAG: DNA polymerase III subunit delta' [Magnetospiraceae bacterium]
MSDSITPRDNPNLFGHMAAEQTLLQAQSTGRMHHGWLITGPRGIGKATLAYRFARYLLAQGAGGTAQDENLFGEPVLPDSLHVSEDHPVFQRVAAGAHGDIRLVTRSLNDRGVLRSEIVVDDVRTVGSFLSMTAAEGGWRIVIVDSADEMNRNAANALLKVLEEPPKRALLLLLAHNPGRLLPTIRSRCRQLPLRPLADDLVAEKLVSLRKDLEKSDAERLARIAEGSIGRALALHEAGGLETYDTLLGVLATLPALDGERVHKLGDTLARAGAENSFRTVTDLLRWWLGRLILYGSGGQINLPADEKALMDRLFNAAPLDRWLSVWENVDHLITRAGGGGNLDRKQVILNAFLALRKAVPEAASTVS